MKMKNRIDYRNALIEKMGVPIEQGETTNGSIRTNYLAAGSGDYVICLHGAGAGAVTWYPSIGAMAEKFHVVAPDIVGYGESDKPNAPYDRPYFSKWLKDFLIQMKIEKAHIVGLSQGGAIALQFAIDYPDRVNKLVVVDAAGLGAKVSFWPLLGMIWMNSFPSATANQFNAPFILNNPAIRDRNHSHYSVAVIKSDGGKNAFKHGKGAAVSKIPEEALQRINNETLIIWGKEDKLFSPEFGEATTKIMPNAKFQLIQGAGHLPLIDQPEIFNKILNDFLNT